MAKSDREAREDRFQGRKYAAERKYAQAEFAANRLPTKAQREVAKSNAYDECAAELRAAWDELTDPRN